MVLRISQSNLVRAGGDTGLLIDLRSISANLNINGEMLFIEVYFTQKFLPNVYIIFVFLCDNKRKPCAVHVGFNNC
jgi:hypothetical protein